MPSVPATNGNVLEKKEKNGTKAKKQMISETKTKKKSDKVKPAKIKPIKNNLENKKNKPSKSLKLESSGSEVKDKQKGKRKSKATAEIVDNNSDQSSNNNDENKDINAEITTITTEGKTIAKRTHAQLGMQSKKEDICCICDYPDNLIACTKGCCSYFHKDCLKIETTIKAETFSCDLCKENKLKCFICSKTSDDEGEGLGKIKRCTVQNCGKSYHSTCLEIHMTKFEECLEIKKNVTSTTQFRCPLHFCETCAVKSATAPKSKTVSRSRYFKCIRCPTAYHIGDECIGAGSSILAGFNIICPKHFTPTRCLPYHHPVHVSWCFICSQGGKLVCCASCPAAFHVECMAMDKEPDGDFYCRDCSSGIRPLYGDLVWIKLGTYRWWPGEVVHPLEVPDNIMRLRHDIGEFVVQFLGSRDYFWLNRCRVFLYQDGDATGTTSTTKNCSKGISTIFKKALAEAEKLYNVKTEIKIKQEIAKSVQNDKKPAPYKHIRVNRPVGKVQIYNVDIKEIPRCSCKPSDPSPCSAESECINHMLLFECHPELCPAADRCENQRFQKCLYPKFDVFKTSWGGWGLKSLENIKKGQFVNEYVGELVDEEECKKRIEKSHENDVTNYYMLTIDKDRIIDAGPKGNFSRFMNHSCDPNCETQKWTVNGDTRVGLFAKHDIAPDSELTFNYNLDCLGNDKTTCKCGAKNCSGYIGERPKPQLKNGEKKEASKKKKRVKRTDNIPQHEDLCFRCRNTGLLLVCCDFKDCLKAYCLPCLNITKPPYGKWECPWHHCDWCGRKAQYNCHFCPNSFCSSHIPNQLRPSIPNRFDCCCDHNPETAEFELNEAISLVYEQNGIDMPEENPIENKEDAVENMDINGPTIVEETKAPVQKKQKRPSTAAAGNKNKATPKITKKQAAKTTDGAAKSATKRKRVSKKDKQNIEIKENNDEENITTSHIATESPSVSPSKKRGKRRRLSVASDSPVHAAKSKRAYNKLPKKQKVVKEAEGEDVDVENILESSAVNSEFMEAQITSNGDENGLVLVNDVKSGVTSSKLMTSGIKVLDKVHHAVDNGDTGGLSIRKIEGLIHHKLDPNALYIDQKRAELSVQAIHEEVGDQSTVSNTSAIKNCAEKSQAKKVLETDQNGSPAPANDEKIVLDVVKMCVDAIAE